MNIDPKAFFHAASPGYNSATISSKSACARAVANSSLISDETLVLSKTSVPIPFVLAESCPPMLTSAQPSPARSSCS